MAARKGYCDLVTAAFAKIHGWGFTLPEPTAIEDVHDPDTFSATTWKSQGNDKIIELDRALWEELEREGCTRLLNSRLPVPIPYVIRPLVNQRGIYEEAMAISAVAVNLCGKALALLLEDRELQRAAGYDETDVRMARPSLANNFSGRSDGERSRPNLPEICRADLILTNRGDLHVLELNTDSPAGMFNLDVLTPWQLEHCRDMGMHNLPLLCPRTERLRIADGHVAGALGRISGGHRRTESPATICGRPRHRRHRTSHFVRVRSVQDVI